MATLSEVQQAEQQSLTMIGDELRSPKELRQQARDGLPPQVVSLAFWRLLNRGELQLDAQRRVRRAQPAA